MNYRVHKMRGIPWQAEELVASQEALWPSAGYTVVATLWAVGGSSPWIVQHPVVSIRTGTEVKENHEPPRPAGRTLRTLGTRSVTGTTPQARPAGRTLGTLRTLGTRSVTGTTPQATLVTPQFVTGTFVRPRPSAKALHRGQRVLCPSLRALFPIRLTLCTSYRSFNLFPVC